MKAVVIGSAHLDVLSTVTGDDLALDKIGRVAIDVGGTGANIALNLRKLGASVSMLTAMNDSPFSRIVREHMESHGVEMVVTTFSGPDAVFSAHVDKDGELLSAISSMPVGHVAFESEAVHGLLLGADCMIVDCNVSGAEMDRLVCIANEMMLPVFIAAVSEEKSLRIRKITGKVDAIFLNSKEAAYLRAHCVRDSASYEDMARALNTTLVVTIGQDGAIVALPSKATAIPPVRVDGIANLLGAGDAFMAATVFHHTSTFAPITEAARAGAELAGEVIRQNHCNTGKPDSVRRLMEVMEFSASRDALTGLLGRARCERDASKAIEEGALRNSPVSTIVIDIDHFKRINDTLGHDAGDKVLRRVSDLIRAGVRDTDIAARWGGEEFVVVLPGTPDEIAFVVAERIRKMVESGMKDIGVTVSCGVATLAAGTTGLAELIKQADERLYAAKNAGRNRVAV